MLLTHLTPLLTHAPHTPHKAYASDAHHISSSIVTSYHLFQVLIYRGLVHRMLTLRLALIKTRTVVLTLTPTLALTLILTLILTLNLLNP